MSMSIKGDDRLVALFKHLAVLNQVRTKAEGRPIYDDIEVVEIRAPGSRNVSVFPALSLSHWSGDEFGGEQSRVTYAERFSHQYKQFKQQMGQTKTGTPLAHVPFLTEGRRAELRALNIYTLEQLAGIDGIELKNMGVGGRDLKNQAIEYIESTKASAPNLAAIAEFEAIKARNQVLEDDNKRLMALQPKSSFENMSDEQLREFVTTNSGKTLLGNPNRKTLERMAAECAPKESA